MKGGQMELFVKHFSELNAEEFLEDGIPHIQMQLVITE